MAPDRLFGIDAKKVTPARQSATARRAGYESVICG
jgi:hypothetical protein